MEVNVFILGLDVGLLIIPFPKPLLLAELPQQTSTYPIRSQYTSNYCVFMTFMFLEQVIIILL